MKVTLTTLALVVIMTGCSHSKSNGSSGSGSATGKVVTPLGHGVVVLETSGRALRVAVEVARTHRQRQRGLMFRKKLADNAGMFFIFGRDHKHTFWMHNTYISLDMIFIDSTRTVVGVVHEAEPLTDTTRGVGKPSRYVLEVNAGWAKRNGVAAGAKVSVEGFSL